MNSFGFQPCNRLPCEYQPSRPINTVESRLNDQVKRLEADIAAAEKLIQERKEQLALLVKIRGY